MYTKLIKWLKSQKNTLLAFVVVVLLITTMIIGVSADDANESNSIRQEFGRTVDTIFTIQSADDEFIGFSLNGNNNPTDDLITVGNSIGSNQNIFNYWEHEASYYYDENDFAFPYDAYYLLVETGSLEQNVINVTLSDFYLHYFRDDVASVRDDIIINFYEYRPLFDDLGVIVYYEYKYYDLLTIDDDGNGTPVIGSGSFDPFDYALPDIEYNETLSIYEFIGDQESIEGLLYFDYFSIEFVVDPASTQSEFSIDVTYNLLPDVRFYHDLKSYTLVTQTEFDNFRISQFAKDKYNEPFPEEILRPYADWVATAVSGFFSFQLFPGFYLGGILVVIIAFTLVMWWLKMFGGG